MTGPKRRSSRVKGRDQSVFSVLDDLSLNINVDGANRKIGVEEALQLKTYNDAMAGDLGSIKAVLGWIEERESSLPKTRHRVIFKRANMNYKRADDALALLGAAYEVPGQASPENGRYLELEPWVVVEALRRRSERLSDKDRRKVESCLRDPAVVNWSGVAGDE